MNTIVSKLKNLYDPENPNERCGFLVGKSKIVEVGNAHPQPEKGFVISAEDMIKYETEAVATWHTHPKQPANLSHEDYRGFSQWPSLVHYIIGIDGVRCFKLDDDLIVEVDLD